MIKRLFFKREWRANEHGLKPLWIMRDSTVFVLAILTAVILVGGLVLISGSGK